MPFLLRGVHVKPCMLPSTNTAPLVPSHVRLEEENNSNYEAKKFYPAKIYELLNSRYQIVAKLGYGATSTVWLARDLKQATYMPDLGAPVRAIVDVPAPVSGRDLKADNIMMALKDPMVLSRLAEAEERSPSAQKRLWDRTIYASRHVFVADTSVLGQPMITDFGLAVKGDGALLYHPIQPNGYRAPEVVLGAEWSYAADIWNLGALFWELATNIGPFDAHDNVQGSFEEKHLARIISILGYPTSDMLTRGRNTHLFFTKQGKLLYWVFRNLTALGAYGGLGNGLALQLPPPYERSERERQLFLAFVGRMLRWRPEDRSNAANLLEDPFLK
ncbi:hypothetical protein KEM54_002619 [Ascosphaera aggregata]|nr:hypothetical protein KEM54_002619 [Ascosphaera aggregata]